MKRRLSVCIISSSNWTEQIYKVPGVEGIILNFVISSGPEVRKQALSGGELFNAPVSKYQIYEKKMAE